MDLRLLCDCHSSAPSMAVILSGTTWWHSEYRRELASAYSERRGLRAGSGQVPVPSSSRLVNEALAEPVQMHLLYPHVVMASFRGITRTCVLPWGLGGIRRIWGDGERSRESKSCSVDLTMNIFTPTLARNWDVEIYLFLILPPEISMCS